MRTLWKIRLPGENPELAESLERTMGRVTSKPAHTHWGMRGGFVKLRTDSTLAVQLAGNDLSVNGYAEELGREDIQSLLQRLADALTSSFSTLPMDEIERLRHLGRDEPGTTSEHSEAAPEAPDMIDSMDAAPGASANSALTDLVLELVTLGRALNSRLESLEARVDVLESRRDVEDTLARAERLAQALKRS